MMTNSVLKAYFYEDETEHSICFYTLRWHLQSEKNGQDFKKYMLKYMLNILINQLYERMYQNNQLHEIYLQALFGRKMINAYTR